MTNEEKINEMKIQTRGIKEKVKSELEWIRACCGYHYSVDIAEDGILNYISKVEKYMEDVLND